MDGVFYMTKCFCEMLFITEKRRCQKSKVIDFLYLCSLNKRLEYILYSLFPSHVYGFLPVFTFEHHHVGVCLVSEEPLPSSGIQATDSDELGIKARSSAGAASAL